MECGQCFQKKTKTAEPGVFECECVEMERGYISEIMIMLRRAIKRLIGVDDLQLKNEPGLKKWF